MGDVRATSDRVDTATPRVMLLERNRAVVSTLRKALESEGYVVDSVPDEDEAIAVCAQRPPDLVIAGADGPDSAGETVCSRLKAEVSPRLPVVLLFGPGDDDAERRATAAGADSYLMAPLKRPAILRITRDTLRIRALSDQIDELERRLDQTNPTDNAPPAPAPKPRPNEGVDAPYDFDFFKKLLLMEVKRSKRYAYPICVALIEFDGFKEITAELDLESRGRLVGALFSQITQSVRDIDIPVLYAEEKVLVFMPHTPREGAIIVGRRLCERIRAHAADFGDSGRLRVTASVGLAAFDGYGTVSFGGLLKGATKALRAAQDAGGDTVEAADAGEPAT